MAFSSSLVSAFSSPLPRKKPGGWLRRRLGWLAGIQRARVLRPPQSTPSRRERSREFSGARRTGSAAASAQPAALTAASSAAARTRSRRAGAVVESTMRSSGSQLVVATAAALWWLAASAERASGAPFDWSVVNLPDEHMPYFFYNNPTLRRACQLDHTCPYQQFVNEQRCWGYEPDCPERLRMSVPYCPENSQWVNTKEEQATMFWEQGDFGHLQRRLAAIKTYCSPNKVGDSSLACDPNARHCRATNIYMDFRAHDFNINDRFKENIFKGGRIGGHCNFSAGEFQSQSQHKSALQSWFGELEDYTSLSFQPVNSGHCDVIVDKLTYFMKLDAGVNMYHHFCDFVNLYGSQHIENNFMTDVNIVMWDTSRMGYGDYFSDTWKAFTSNPIIRLSDFAGKRMCFRDVVFPMLPRQRFGLFYNMPLINGCYGSSLFHAFSQHVLHRLNVPQQAAKPGKIRVTLLSRKSQYRNILNEADLVSAVRRSPGYEVRLVQYSPDKLPFVEQLKVTHSSDIFIGLHGAGLTHGLFQPDWGVLMELYNCEDERCYKDLARLRGVKYMTWERPDKMTQEDEGHHPTLGAHAKFTNYWFDVNEFMRLIGKAADYVRSHPTYMLSLRETVLGTVDRDEL